MSYTEYPAFALALDGLVRALVFTIVVAAIAYVVAYALRSIAEFHRAGLRRVHAYEKSQEVVRVEAREDTFASQASGF